MQVTSVTDWRAQSSENRQGSSSGIANDVGQQLTARERELQALARSVYEERLTLGVAREQARKDLPLSTYTEAYWKLDLHNLLHFLRLRMDSHAQHEIRSYANIIGNEVVARWCPIAWGAFQDYQLGALQLSKVERSIVSKLAQGQDSEAISELQSLGILTIAEGKLLKNREREDLEYKLHSLGISIPWLIR
jgi:thymidylate synthase (FAD)